MKCYCPWAKLTLKGKNSLSGKLVLGRGRGAGRTSWQPRKEGREGGAVAGPAFGTERWLITSLHTWAASAGSKAAPSPISPTLSHESWAHFQALGKFSIFRLDRDPDAAQRPPARTVCSLDRSLSYAGRSFSRALLMAKAHLKPLPGNIGEGVENSREMGVKLQAFNSCSGPRHGEGQRGLPASAGVSLEETMTLCNC